MTTPLLFAAALLSSSCGCESPTSVPRSRAHVVAALQADKPTPKEPAPSAPAPAKKPAPKERDSRPTPPAHLFM